MDYELKGPTYLRTKLTTKRTRVLTRYKYYEMKSKADDLRISTPPELQWLIEVLGWCGKGVDALADRLCFKGFDNDFANLYNIYKLNNPDILFDDAILSALISSCSFIYISQNDDGSPRMEVIDGGNATGIIDRPTGLLREGYAVLERDDKDNPKLEAYFEPGKTTYYEVGGKQYEISNAVAYPLLVPIIYKPDAKRPFGHSRISRACMGAQDAAIRTMKRSEVAAEFYSYPQKYVTGLAQDHEEMEKWKATMSSMLTFEVDDQGNHPVLGQFQAASMEPHLAQFKMFAAIFAGETGLTLDDLGFATGNPASSEAIKASHATLARMANKAKRCFGSGFVNAGFLAACLRDDRDYKRNAFCDTTALWEPSFEADGAALSGMGDAISKINSAIPGYIDEKKVNQMTGI